MTPVSPQHRTQVSPKASGPRHPSLSPPESADQQPSKPVPPWVMGQEEALGCWNLPQFGTGTAWSCPVLSILSSPPARGAAGSHYLGRGRWSRTEGVSGRAHSPVLKGREGQGEAGCVPPS